MSKSGASNTVSPGVTASVGTTVLFSTCANSEMDSTRRPSAHLSRITGSALAPFVLWGESSSCDPLQLCGVISLPHVWFHFRIAFLPHVIPHQDKDRKIVMF